MRPRPYRYLLASLALGVLLAGANPLTLDDTDIVRPVVASGGMVVSSEPLATEAGVAVLQNGGNAVDAAVTVGFVLAVVRPRAGNIGGGGFMLIKQAGVHTVKALDYREVAPAAAHRDMFLDAGGNVDSERSRFSHLSAGVPGTVAGLALALAEAGTISLAAALAPAIALAADGFTVTADLAGSIENSAERLRRWPGSAKVFFKADGSPYQPGDRFLQPDLAATLKSIAERGTDGFYRGPVADLIAAEMARHGGGITKDDLAAYRARWREPVHGNYRGYEIFSMSPPSSGGIHIVQILNILEGYDLAGAGHNSARTVHLMAEAMKRAYADRSQHLGDTDFVDVPIAGLTSKAYAAQLRAGIDEQRATPSSALRPGKPAAYESRETTHFSVVDRHGNAVSNTYTINFGFGSGIVVSGAGFLLNNEMDDFSAKPGVPNAYGLVGGEANAIAPGKRMLSSMSPTMVLRDGEPYLVTGSPGGSRIITTTLQIVINVIDHQFNIQEAVNAVRIHHQWLPDELRVEPGLSADTIGLLAQFGHTIVPKATMGAAHSILARPAAGIFHGAADPRRDGLALGPSGRGD